MKILLIEDEVKAGQYLRKGLGEASYVVDIAYNGVDGLHMALKALTICWCWTQCCRGSMVSAF